MTNRVRWLIVAIIVLAMVATCILINQSKRESPKPPSIPPSAERVTYSLSLPVIASPATTKGGLALASPVNENWFSWLGINHYHKWTLSNQNFYGGRFVMHFACQPHYYNGRDQLSILFSKTDFWSDHVLLFYNEPDLSDQCNKPPKQAADIYQVIIAQRPHLCIVGPQVSHQDYLNNWAWLRAFYQELNDRGLPMPCAAGLHDYMDYVDPVVFLDSYQSMASQYGAPTDIWMTEFATVYPSMLVRYRQVYDSRPDVKAYFWWQHLGNRFSLFSDTITYSPTELGEAWIEYER